MEQEAMKNESANAAVEKGEKKAAKTVTRATKARRQKEILKKLLKARAYKWNELLEEAVKEYVAKYDDEEADIPDLKGKFGSNFSLLEEDGEVAFDKATNLCTLAGTGKGAHAAQAEKSMTAAAEDGGSVTGKADERAKADAAKAQEKKETAANAKETAVVSAADSSADSASSAALEKKAGGDNAGKAEEKPRAKRGRKPMKKEENADTENKAKSGEKQADEKKAAIEKSLKAAVEKAAAKAAVRRTKNDAENVKTIEKKAEEVAAESAAKSTEEKISSGEKTDAEIAVAEEKPTAKRRGRKPAKKADEFAEKAFDMKAAAATGNEKAKEADNRENTKNTPIVITTAEKNEAGEEKAGVSTDVPAEKRAKIDGSAREKQAIVQAKKEKSAAAFEAFGFIGRDESAKKAAEQSAEKNEREKQQEKKTAKNDFLTDFIFLGNAAKKSGNEDKEAKKSVAGENKNTTAETAGKTENVAAPEISAEKKESAKTEETKATPKGGLAEEAEEIARNAAAENVPAEAKNVAKPSVKNEKDQGQGRGNRENAKSETRAAIQPAAQAQSTATNGGRGARNGQRTPRVTEKYAQSADDKLKEEFLKRLRSLSGEYFEYYSVYLLERYSLKSGRRLEGLRISGGKNDGGIDGEIELTDRFGFRETIYIQAKNWDPTKGLAEKWMIGETLIQQFVGAATCRQSKDCKRNCRGIFVTTSTFTKEAKEVLSVLGEKFIGYDGNDVYETAKECEFGLIQVNGVWQLDEKLLSSDKAFFNM
ncbi:MAG: restriction endonuclease [Clostridiales bacterium]|nr:restriction endonuclease [Clostridiales bacterium]MDY4894525.1 restriction endonuclease [Christensenellaceae bacterium]